MMFYVILGNRRAKFHVTDNVPLPQVLDFVEAQDYTDGTMFFGIVKQRKFYLNKGYVGIYLENIP